MSGLDTVIDKFLEIVFQDKKKVSRKEFMYRSCSAFRVDKKLAKALLRYLENEGYVINRREEIEITNRKN